MWSVAALVRAVVDALTARFSVCKVRGEISGFSRAASGHCYFNLKDAEGGHSGAALIRCTMFRRAAALLDFSPADGQLVELRGRLGVYEARGELQLVVEAMTRAGDGALYEKFLRLKAKLEAQGLFDAARKRNPPAYPSSVGVVTSLGAAALQDVVTTLMRRAPHVRVVVYPSLVQGAEAPAAICAALARAGQRAEVDVLLVCRGGGSLEDLWAFNDEGVVRAIAAAPMPVIVGVGHETDVTLADFAADLRAATPTAAAELAAPSALSCLTALATVAALLQRRARFVLDTGAQRLDHVAARLMRPAEVVQRRGRQLDGLAHRLRAGLGRHLDLRHAHLVHMKPRLHRASEVLNRAHIQRLDNLSLRLDALDPRHVLARGYAWLTDEAGRAVQSTAQLATGDSLHATLHDGAVGVVVTSVQPRSSD